MKKLTFLVAALFATTLAFAGTITIDESKVTWGTSYADCPSTFTVSGQTFDVVNLVKAKFNSDSVLQFSKLDESKSRAAGYIANKESLDLVSIVLTKAGNYQNLTVYAGATAADLTKVDLVESGSTYTATMPEGAKFFKVINESNYSAQCTSIAINVEGEIDGGDGGDDGDDDDHSKAFYVYKSDGTTVEFAVAKVDSISFMKLATDTVNGRVWVSLGLPSGTKWATCNVGATSPEKYGNYYAWGETTTKAIYSWDTYKYGSAKNALTKYCNNSSYGKNGFTDNLTELEMSDDAATANWGEEWRMPTIDEWQELIDNCTWIWTTLKGVEGYEVKGTNGNTIFLPAAGYLYYDADRSSARLYGAGDYGDYWSSSLHTGDYAWYVCNAKRSSADRYYGLSVRPVLK